MSRIEFNVYPSKIYLTLSLGVYFLSLFVAWYYFYNLWLSIILSVVLSVWVFFLLPKLRLTHPNSITKISLNKGILITENNSHLVQHFSKFYPVYQSRFLIIISTQQTAIVLFQDALKSTSISQLNRYFKVKGNLYDANA